MLDDESDDAASERVLTLKLMAADCEWLVSLPFHRFWSQCAFDPTINTFIDSYLQHATRPGNIPSNTHDDVRSGEMSLYRAVLIVLVRLSSNHETSDQYLKPSTYAALIYDKWLFDVPRFIDVCTLYGKTNQPLVSSMLTSIATLQPKYVETDLPDMAQSLLSLLNKVLEQCGLPQTPVGVAALGTKHVLTAASSSNKRLTTKQIVDVISYLRDLCQSLFMFIHVFRPAAKSLAEVNFVISLAQCYEHLCPYLQSSCGRTDDAGLFVQLGKLIGKYMRLAHEVIVLCYLNRDTSSGIDDTGAVAIDALEPVCSLPRFVSDFQKKYSLLDCLGQLSDRYVNIDQARLARLQSAIVDLAFTPTPSSQAPVPTSTAQTGLSSVDATAESLVSAVKDLLPDLGDGFILACLKHYNVCGFWGVLLHSKAHTVAG